MSLNVGSLFASLNLQTDNFDKNLSASMQRLINSAARIQTNLASAGRSGGRMFASGLAGGIASGRSAVVSAAARLAAAAVAAANARLKIASPSRVMRESGGYFAEGFAVGISASARMAASAARDMATLAASSTKTDKRLSVFDNPESAQLPEVSLYMDSRLLARIAARENARAQADRQGRIALGYGLNRR